MGSSLCARAQLLPPRRPLHCRRRPPSHRVFPNAVNSCRVLSTAWDVGTGAQGQVLPEDEVLYVGGAQHSGHFEGPPSVGKLCGAATTTHSVCVVWPPPPPRHKPDTGLLR